MERRVSKQIFLTGFSGVGKTQLGKKLALKLGFPFIDLDSVIETEMKKSITTIFEKKGEVFFRKIENRVLKKVIKKNSTCVIALGGGTLLSSENLKIIKKHGILIYLKMNKGLLLLNASKIKNRPLLKNLSKNRLNELFQKRVVNYEKSNYTIKVPNSKKFVIKSIIEKISKDFV